EWGLRVHIVQQPHFGGIVKDPVPSTHARLSVTLYVPGEAKARTQVVEIGSGARLGNCKTGKLVSREEQSGRRVREMRRFRSLDVLLGTELNFAILEVGYRSVGLPAQSKIQRQRAIDPDGIGKVEPLIVVAPKFDFSIALTEQRHRSQDVIGLVKTCYSSIESIHPRPVEHVVLVIAGPFQIGAPDHIVASANQPPGVRDLEVRTGEDRG